MDLGATERAHQPGTATRIALRPHDPRTDEEIEKSEIVKGYEYGRDQLVTFTAEELKARQDIEFRSVRIVRNRDAPHSLSPLRSR